MGPFGAPVFGAAVLGKREKWMSQVSRAYFWVRQADQKMGPPICIFFWLAKKTLSSNVGVGGSVDEAQL